MESCQPIRRLKDNNNNNNNNKKKKKKKKKTKKKKKKKMMMMMMMMAVTGYRIYTGIHVQQLCSKIRVRYGPIKAHLCEYDAHTTF